MKAELETVEFKPVQAENLEEIDRRLEHINNKLEKLEGSKPDSTNNLRILVLLFLAIAAGFFVAQYNPQLTGLVTYTYTFEKYLNLSTSTNQILNLELNSSPNSLRISGVLIGNGNASVYLLVNNSRILVGEIRGNQTKLGGITGMTINEVVDENNTATNTSLILMNESAIPDNVSIVLNESAGDLSNNVTLDQELVADKSTDKHKNASVLLINPFDGLCVDTCSLTNAGANISLEIEVYNATLNLSKIMYTIEKEAEKKKNEPYWNSSVDAFIVNGRSYINLSKYFIGSGLSFLVSPAENISLFINGSVLDIVPAVGVVGERLVTVFASDFDSTVSKDVTLVVNSSVGNVFTFANLSFSNVSNASFAAYPSRFVIRNSYGTAIAAFDSSGYLFLAGKSFVGQKDLVAAQGSFVVRDSNLSTIAYINSTGYLFLAGNIFSDVINLSSDIGFQIRNSSMSVVALIDAQGNLKLRKEVNENYAVR